MDWFLYDRDRHHEGVKNAIIQTYYHCIGHCRFCWLFVLSCMLRVPWHIRSNRFCHHPHILVLISPCTGSCNFLKNWQNTLKYLKMVKSNSNIKIYYTHLVNLFNGYHYEIFRSLDVKTRPNAKYFWSTLSLNLDWIERFTEYLVGPNNVDPNWQNFRRWRNLGLRNMKADENLCRRRFH